MGLQNRLKFWMHRLLQGVPSARAPRQALGKRAEDRAARFLRQQGYRILERNFHCPQGEIDLIAFRDGVIAFTEVRARTEPVGLDALATVTELKRRRLIRAAHAYVSFHNLTQENVDFRFDVISLRYASDGTLLQVEHIPGAFQE